MTTKQSVCIEWVTNKKVIEQSKKFISDYSIPLHLTTIAYMTFQSNQ